MRSSCCTPGYSLASGGFLTGYDDKPLSTLVAIAIKHDVKLFLCEPNYCGDMFTRLLFPAEQQYPYECGVEDAKFRAVTKEPVTNQHRLIVRPSMIEQDFRLDPDPRRRTRSPL